MTATPVPVALGPPRRAVRPLPPEPRWPALAPDGRLLGLSADEPPIEHGGGKSVPGLAARPIPGLLSGVEQEASRTGLIASLRRARCAHREKDAVPGRLNFNRDDAAGRRTQRASVSVAGWQLRTGRLAFRDARRRDAPFAAAHRRRKQKIAACFLADRIARSAGKSDAIAAVLRARSRQ